jgi:hypothetical protein
MHAVFSPNRHWFAILAFVALGFGCKSRQKPRTVEGDAPEVLVNLQNMQDVDGSQSNYLYVASDCGSQAAHSGVVKEANKISFRIKGIKTGDRCTVRVENPGASVQELGFKSDQFLLYEAKDVVVGQDLSGQYIATAFLQKQYYYRGNQRYNLSVSANFEKSIKGSKLTGDLTCAPQIFIASDTFAATGDAAGDFTFSAVAPNTPTEVTCTQLNVFENKKLVFSANFKSPAFRPKAGDSVKLSTDPVELKVAVTAPTGVIVETSGSNSSCKEGEFFNTETRRCETRN